VFGPFGAFLRQQQLFLDRHHLLQPRRRVGLAAGAAQFGAGIPVFLRCSLYSRSTSRRLLSAC
jgi:hypothetical protein